MSDFADESIDLAHAPDLALGRLVVRPSVRQIVRDDGESEVLEPRVMQVLLALARADGGIVTRDELTRWCWEDRVVGEDAINRVISRLRRVAEGIGAGSFKIETITKVGYRLLRSGKAPESTPVASPQPETAPLSKTSRRGLIVGGGAALAAVVAGSSGFYIWKHRKPPVNPQAAELVRQGLLMLREDTRVGQKEAIGLFQSAVAIQPDYADGWGALAMSYGLLWHFSPVAEGEALRGRVASAADRADAIEPGNAYSQLARAWLLPIRGNWLLVERALRRALADHPQHNELLSALAAILANVGRPTEAAELLQRARASGPPNPSLLYNVVMAYWEADRLDDADRAIEEASKLYPSQFAIWFARVYIDMYSGRAPDALKLLGDVEHRPSGIPVSEFANVTQVAETILTRTPANIDKVMALCMERAHQGNGYAENALQFACALGRIDEAFAVAEAYYFGRGFVVPAIRFSIEQASYMPQSERLTRFLFNPSTAVMRRDPRFGPLVDELELTKYWKDAGVIPDYRKI